VNGFGAGNVTEGGTATNSTGGDHAVDNGTAGATGGAVDALLLKFTGGAEALTHVTVGWTGADGDFQICAGLAERCERRRTDDWQKHAGTWCRQRLAARRDSQRRRRQ
jgi:hypothetical protein